MPYRDDQAALEERRDDLRRDLDELAAKAEELRAAVRDQDEVARELAATEARLARRMGRRVALLDDVRVASPCTASWEAMTGDDRVRFCGECKKNVYNLSAMARADAERLLAEREGSICVRLYKRADDTVITADCPVGLRRKRVRRAAVAAVAGAGALAASSAWLSQACLLQGDVGPPERASHATQGVIEPEVHYRYTDVPLEAPSERGLVLSYWRDDPLGKSPRQWLKLYADGRVVHEVGPASHTTFRSSSEGNPEPAAGILRMAAELGPRGVVVTDDFADSAAFEGFAFHGTGHRAGTEDDARSLHEDARRLIGLQERSERGD